MCMDFCSGHPSLNQTVSVATTLHGVMNNLERIEEVESSQVQ